MFAGKPAGLPLSKGPQPLKGNPLVMTAFLKGFAGPKVPMCVCVYVYI